MFWFIAPPLFLIARKISAYAKLNEELFLYNNVIFILHGLIFESFCY